MLHIGSFWGPESRDPCRRRRCRSGEDVSYLEYRFVLSNRPVGKIIGSYAQMSIFILKLLVGRKYSDYQTMDQRTDAPTDSRSIAALEVVERSRERKTDGLVVSNLYIYYGAENNHNPASVKNNSFTVRANNIINQSCLLQSRITLSP